MRSSVRSSAIVTTLTVVGGITAFAFAPITGRHAWVGILLGAGIVAFVVPLTVVRARAIAASERPIFDVCETLALVFTLLVLGFATMYLVLAREHGQMADVHTKIDAVYFTLATLGTVGYGDAHPVGQTARLVASVQIVFDILYIAAAVRLLTTVAERRNEQRKSEL